MIVPDNDREPWQAHTLRAWQEAFGTTQLTHAKARLERAEDHMRRVEEAEARCCPEDVGFEEWIGVLKKRLDEALRASPPEAEGEDAKRLDWLEQLTIPSEEINDLIRNWCVNGKRYPEGIRAAVDAAMRVWT
jgi:hypothetical protein